MFKPRIMFHVHVLSKGVNLVAMKTKLALTAILVVAVGLIFTSTRSKAQTPTSAARWEVAIIKWDGPDKIQFITPQKTEYVRVFKAGVKLPDDIHDEEFCVNWAANKLAQDGWEPVALNASRLLLKRQVR
jgi:hypothetical protein